MFLKYKVDIPVVPGKLVRKNRGGHTYIEYEYDRIYDPVKVYITDLAVFICGIIREINLPCSFSPSFSYWFCKTFPISFA